MITHITLVTTIPNKVVDSLQKLTNCHLTIVDATHVLTNSIRSPIVDSYHVLVTYRCPYIVPEEIINSFSMVVNIHPSLLPQYPGLNPWINMLANGDTRGRHNNTQIKPIYRQWRDCDAEIFRLSSPDGY